MRAAIETLGQGTSKAGPSSVLRVLISSPAEFVQNIIIDAAKSASDPIATVNLTRLVNQRLEVGVLRSLGVRLEAAAQQRKRKRESAALDRRTKPRLE